MQSGASKQIRMLYMLVLVFVIEKMLQHSLTALFFLLDIPGIGTPNIGTNYQVSPGVMGILNIIYFLVLVLSVVGFTKQKRWSIHLIMGLALLDIVLEFVFHGLFYITVSVIVSALLSIFALRYMAVSKRETRM